MDNSSWRPVCHEHGSSGYKVLRDGWDGKAPRRRQRYRCVNVKNKEDFHRFVPQVPRLEAMTEMCLDCESGLAAGQGPSAARRYDYVSREIASALVSLAGGATYMEASRAVRTNLARSLQDHGHKLPWSAETISHGQLAATWVETYAEVVLGADEVRAWPDAILLDSTSFWRFAGEGRRRPAFHVLFAYGYDDAGPAPIDPWQVHPATGEVLRGRRHGAGRLLRAVAYQAGTAESWQDFLQSLPGTPEVVVADSDNAIRAALRATWPRTAGQRAPEFVRCRWHLLQNLREAVVDDLVQLDTSDATRPTKVKRAQSHPLHDAAGAAFHSAEDWRAFYSVAYDTLLHRFAGEMPSTLRWLRDNELVMLTQLARRPERLGPESVGPLEADINVFRSRLATRAQTLANRDRTNLLLRLMVAGRRGQANEQVWAERVRQYLISQEGTPPEQRPLVLPAGVRTL